MKAGFPRWTDFRRRGTSRRNGSGQRGKPAAPGRERPGNHLRAKLRTIPPSAALSSLRRQSRAAAAAGGATPRGRWARRSSRQVAQIVQAKRRGPRRSSGAGSCAAAQIVARGKAVVKEIAREREVRAGGALRQLRGRGRCAHEGRRGNCAPVASLSCCDRVVFFHAGQGENDYEALRWAAGAWMLKQPGRVYG